MNVKNQPTVSGWSLEHGYANALNGIEYPLRVTNVGRRTGSTVLFKFNQDDLEYLCKGSDQGISVILSTPGETLKMGNSFQMPHSEYTKIAIKTKLTETSQKLRAYTPYQRQCFFSDERQLRFYRNYTQSNCEAECLANFTKIECGCVAFFMPRTITLDYCVLSSKLNPSYSGDRNTKICGGAKIDCYQAAGEKLMKHDLQASLSKEEPQSLIQKCNCLPACTTIEYKADVSHVEFELEIMRKSFNISLDE